MVRSFHLVNRILLLLLLDWASSVAVAANTAIEWISYVPGTGAAGYETPGATLGGIKPITDPAFPTIVTPHNPPYLNSDICVVGGGGEIVLRFAETLVPLPGSNVGVFSNNGLVDTNWPTGQNSNPAALFSPPGIARVSVSQDGTNWSFVGADPIVFDAPTNYYADLGPDPSNTTVHGTVVADIARPFAGHLNDFDGLNWTQTKALLNGSAGGTWIDISSAGVAQVNFIRFQVPAGTGNRLVIDAVSTVPEPAGAAILLGLLLPLISRARAVR
jgi:hypothetical protein